MKEYNGKIRLVIKHYPYEYRDFSHIAAEASLAAMDQEKFWEMHHLLLKRSPKLDRNSLIKYAQEIGLDVKIFTDSLEKMRHLKIIERDKKVAVDMDIYNTPTFFINGRKVIGNRPYEYFKRIIEEELKGGKK